MIYYANKNKEKIKKYIANIKKNNNNYSISLYVSEGKLQISIKYTEINSDEIFEYNNFYSYHQLQIINKYFKNFDSLETICRDLDKLLKNNKVSIESKKDFLILLIKVLMKKETTNIIFKLFRNKVTNFNRNKRRLNAPHILNNSRFNYKNSFSMPKYNNNENEMKNVLSNLNDRVSNLENNNRYDSASRENIKNNEENENKMFLSNLNNILKRINKLEELNESKDNRIKELEGKIGKYEDNISKIMSYPVYSIKDKSQKSRNDNNINNISYIKKKKKSNNSNDFEVDINDSENENINNNNSVNKKEGIIRNKNKNIKKKDTESNFKEIEESKDQSNDNILSNKNTSFRDNDSKISKNGKKKLKNKRRANSRKNKILDESKNDNKYDENKRENNHKRSSYSSQSDKSSNKKTQKEEEKKNENSDEKSSEKEEKENKRTKNNKSNDSYSNTLEENVKKKNESSKRSNSFEEEEEEKEKEKEKEKAKINEELKKKMAQTGLPMVEREDIKDYINSRIFFTKKELQFVKNKISDNNKHLHAYFELLYRASIDRDYENTINFLCEGFYPQIILFYTEEGARFGVYIHKEKTKNFFGVESYKEVESTSFLISLNSLKTYDILKGKKATDDREEKLCFGRSFYFNDNGSNWLIYTPRNEFLYQKCMIGDKESSFGKIDTNEIVGIIKDYHLKEVEIFKVVIYTDDDDDGEESNISREKKLKNRNYSKKRNSDNNNDDINIKNTQRDEEDED